MTWKARELHFIAIGGAGMSGLALVAHRLGATVTGSDRTDSSYLQRLRAAGLAPLVGHDADAVPAGADVVVSTAIPPDNPELVRARERGQRVLHRGELLAELCAEGRLIAIAGTHGKTTTTGMVVHALRGIGADPAFFIGGDLPGAGAISVYPLSDTERFVTLACDGGAVLGNQTLVPVYVRLGAAPVARVLEVPVFREGALVQDRTLNGLLDASGRDVTVTNRCCAGSEGTTTHYRIAPAGALTLVRVEAWTLASENATPQTTVVYPKP